MVTNDNDTGNKIKVETEAKEREHKMLGLIKIDIIKVQQQKYTESEIITFTIYPIIHISFNKHTM